MAIRRIIKNLQYQSDKEPKDLSLSLKRKIKLPYFLKQVLYLNDRIIYRLLVNTFEYKNNENIYCIDNEGKLLWQVESKDNFPNPIHPYTGIRLDEKTGELWAYNWNGFDCQLDIETGKVLKQIFTK